MTDLQRSGGPYGPGSAPIHRYCYAMDRRKRIVDWFFSQSWAIPVWIILGALVAPFACVVALIMLLKLLGVLA
jgi:hypothetical protein